MLEKTGKLMAFKWGGSKEVLLKVVRVELGKDRQRKVW
jgi:hypothetical protein